MAIATASGTLILETQIFLGARIPNDFALVEKAGDCSHGAMVIMSTLASSNCTSTANICKLLHLVDCCLGLDIFLSLRIGQQQTHEFTSIERMYDILDCGECPYTSGHCKKYNS